MRFSLHFLFSKSHHFYFPKLKYMPLKLNILSNINQKKFKHMNSYQFLREETSLNYSKMFGKFTCLQLQNVAICSYKDSCFSVA